MTCRSPEREGVPPRISIIIINYRSEEFLGPCLAALERNRPARPCEILIVDNASPTWPLFTRPSLDLPLTCFSLERNAGFSSANNAAVARAQGDILFFLNPDTIVLPGAIDRLADLLISDTTIGAVVPRMLNPDGTFQVSASRFYSPLHLPFVFDGVAAHALPSGIDPWIRLYRRYDQVRDVDWAIMAAFMARRETFTETGGLDERFFLFAEDVDFCRRLHRLGRRIVYQPGAVVVHHGLGSARKDSAGLHREKERGLRTYYEINFPTATAAFFDFSRRRRAFQQRCEGWRLGTLGENRFSRAIKVILLLAQLAAELALVIRLGFSAGQDPCSRPEKEPA